MTYQQYRLENHLLLRGVRESKTMWRGHKGVLRVLCGAMSLAEPLKDGLGPFSFLLFTITPPHVIVFILELPALCMLPGLGSSTRPLISRCLSY